MYGGCYKQRFFSDSRVDSSGEESQEKDKRTLAELIHEHWLPQALLIGVDYNLFWSMTPKKLKPFIEAQKQKDKAEFEMMNYQCWLTGLYNLHAINAVMSEGKAKYYEKPIDFSIKPVDPVELAVIKFEAYALQFNKKFNEGAKNNGSRPTGNPDTESSEIGDSRINAT